MLPETFNAVNTLTSIRNLQNKVVEFLINNNDELWKLLYYPDNDAPYKPNLTKDEKRKLIYKGEEDESPYRVFLQSYQDDLVEERQSRMYVDIHRIKPITIQQSIVTISIEIMSANKILTLTDGTNRNTLLLQNIISTLNGQDFGGITYLTFCYDNNGDIALYQQSDKKMYSGFKILMSCQVSNLNDSIEMDC